MNTAVMGPAFVILGVGVVVGLVFAMRGQRSDASVVAQSDRNDLLSTQDEVLLALKQLELDKHKLDPSDYAAERAALVARGAAALRALRGPSGAPGSGASAGIFASGPLAGGDPSAPSALTLASLPDLPMPPGSEDTLSQLRDLLDEHGSERFRAALVALARERPKAVVPQLVAEAEAAPAPVEPPQGAVPQAATVPVREQAMAPQYQGALAVIAILALLGGLYWVAQGDTVARRDGAPMSGNQSLGSGQSAPPPPGALPPGLAAEVQQLEARVASNPQDVQALNDLTEIYLSSNDAGRAMDYNNKAYAVAPEDPTTLTFKAVLRAMVSMFPESIQMLEEVVVKHPDHAMAWTYLGLIQTDKGDKARGLEALRKAVELQPDNFGLKQALQRAEAGQPLTGGPPPEPAAPPPAGGGSLVVSGTVKLAEGVTVRGSEMVFVSLKDPAGGPPLAAKRYPASALPMEFTLTTDDQVSMGGPPRPLPASMQLSIRVDADNDGNAMTKTPLDPTVTTGVSLGQTGLALELAVP